MAKKSEKKTRRRRSNVEFGHKIARGFRVLSAILLRNWTAATDSNVVVFGTETRPIIIKIIVVIMALT